jgi:Zn-dependent peptidase ImmA (M78 family)/transcriptional regulator with XRE-family HTH domain
LSRADLGRRIARAREAARLSQANVAERVSLSQSAISRIESGLRGVDSLELAGIADALGVSVLDLLEPRPLAQRLRVAARQQDAESTAVEKAIDRVSDVVRLWELIDVHLPEHASAPAVHVPTRGLAIDQGRILAVEAREQWNLGDDPLPELFGVIEDMAGLPVLLEPLGSGLDGLLVRTEQLALALVDSSGTFGRQRFTAAHELCHFLAADGELLVVDKDVLAGGSTSEMRANAFAAHFLMPRVGIERYLRDRAVDGNVLAELQFVFGVSLESLLWHLLNTGFISKNERRRFKQIGAKTLAFRAGYADEWDAAEQRRGVRRPPRMLLLEAIDAYAEGLIGIEPLADLLGRGDTEELRRELDDHGIGREDRWWEPTAPA